MKTDLPPLRSALAGVLCLAGTALAFPTQPAGTTPAAAGDIVQGFSGKVTEIVKASRYIYVQVDTGSDKVWAATPSRPLAVGDEVVVPGGMLMEAFVSPELGRTFEKVYFVGGIRLAGEEPAEGSLPAGHPPMDGMENMPAGHPPLDALAGQADGHPPVEAPTTLEFDGLEKPADGKTVADLFADSQALNGKSVTLRGKVTKVNNKILKRNWLHLQDGTGEEGSNDLVVTTQDNASVGDTVLVKGTVKTDANFGFGYKYDLILEKAEITVEKPAKD